MVLYTFIKYRFIYSRLCNSHKRCHAAGGLAPPRSTFLTAVVPKVNNVFLKGSASQTTKQVCFSQISILISCYALNVDGHLCTSRGRRKVIITGRNGSITTKGEKEIRQTICCCIHHFRPKMEAFLQQQHRRNSWRGCSSLKRIAKARRGIHTRNAKESRAPS